MNIIIKWTTCATVALLAGAAQAQAIRITVPDEVPVATSTLTRAEVIADYQVWRLAGLEALNRGDEGPDTDSAEYREALAKYSWLRASPQFKQLVAQLSDRPNALVLATEAAPEAHTAAALPASR